MARSLHTPVIGLYAVARPELSGPYEQLDYTVNKYEEAVKTISAEILSLLTGITGYIRRLPWTLFLYRML